MEPAVSKAPSLRILVIVGALDDPEFVKHISQTITRGISNWSNRINSSEVVNELFTSFPSKAKVCVSEDEPGFVEVYYSTSQVSATLLVNPTFLIVKNEIARILLTPAKDRLIVYGGHSIDGRADWYLQDGLFSPKTLLDILTDPKVISSISESNDKLHLTISSCFASKWILEEDLNDSESFDLVVSDPFDTRMTDIQNLSLNGVGDGHSAGVGKTLEHFGEYLEDVTSEQVDNMFVLLEPPTQEGFLKIRKPCLYVFPAGTGDSTFFTVNGFNILINGGSLSSPGFWRLLRHLDRLDCIIATHLGADSLAGLNSLFLRKMQEKLLKLPMDNTTAEYKKLASCLISPDLGVFCLNTPTKFGEMVARKKSTDVFPGEEEGTGGAPPEVAKLLDIQTVKIVEDTLRLTKGLGLEVLPLTRKKSMEPFTVFSKVGIGKLDIYVISPEEGSSELDFIREKWGCNSKSLHVTGKTGVTLESGEEGESLMSDLASICCLIVWYPTSPNEKIVRVLFPGNAPQSKVLQGLEKMADCGFLSMPSPTAALIAKKKPEKAAHSPTKPPRHAAMNGKPTSSAHHRPTTAPSSHPKPSGAANSHPKPTNSHPKPAGSHPKLSSATQSKTTAKSSAKPSSTSSVGLKKGPTATGKAKAAKDSSAAATHAKREAASGFIKPVNKRPKPEKVATTGAASTTSTATAGKAKPTSAKAKTGPVLARAEARVHAKQSSKVPEAKAKSSAKSSSSSTTAKSASSLGGKSTKAAAPAKKLAVGQSAALKGKSPAKDKKKKTPAAVALTTTVAHDEKKKTGPPSPPEDLTAAFAKLQTDEVIHEKTKELSKRPSPEGQDIGKFVEVSVARVNNDESDVILREKEAQIPAKDTDLDSAIDAEYLNIAGGRQYEEEASLKAATDANLVSDKAKDEIAPEEQSNIASDIQPTKIPVSEDFEKDFEFVQYENAEEEKREVAPEEKNENHGAVPAVSVHPESPVDHDREVTSISDDKQVHGEDEQAVKDPVVHEDEGPEFVEKSSHELDEQPQMKPDNDAAYHELDEQTHMKPDDQDASYHEVVEQSHVKPNEQASYHDLDAQDHVKVDNDAAYHEPDEQDRMKADEEIANHEIIKSLDRNATENFSSHELDEQAHVKSDFAIADYEINERIHTKIDDSKSDEHDEREEGSHMKADEETAEFDRLHNENQRLLHDCELLPDVSRELDHDDEAQHDEKFQDEESHDIHEVSNREPQDHLYEPEKSNDHVDEKFHEQLHDSHRDSTDEVHEEDIHVCEQPKDEADVDDDVAAICDDVKNLAVADPEAHVIIDDVITSSEDHVKDYEHVQEPPRENENLHDSYEIIPHESEDEHHEQHHDEAHDAHHEDHQEDHHEDHHEDLRENLHEKFHDERHENHQDEALDQHHGEHHDELYSVSNADHDSHAPAPEPEQQHKSENKMADVAGGTLAAFCAPKAGESANDLSMSPVECAREAGTTQTVTFDHSSLADVALCQATPPSGGNGVNFNYLDEGEEEDSNGRFNGREWHPTPYPSDPLSMITDTSPTSDLESYDAHTDLGSMENIDNAKMQALEPQNLDNRMRDDSAMSDTPLSSGLSTPTETPSEKADEEARDVMATQSVDVISFDDTELDLQCDKSLEKDEAPLSDIGFSLSTTSASKVAILESPPSTTDLDSAYNLPSMAGSGGVCSTAEADDLKTSELPSDTHGRLSSITDFQSLVLPDDREAQQVESDLDSNGNQAHKQLVVEHTPEPEGDDLWQKEMENQGSAEKSQDSSPAFVAWQPAEDENSSGLAISKEEENQLEDISDEEEEEEHHDNRDLFLAGGAAIPGQDLESSTSPGFLHPQEDEDIFHSFGVHQLDPEAKEFDPLHSSSTSAVHQQLPPTHLPESSGAAEDQSPKEEDGFGRDLVDLHAHDLGTPAAQKVGYEQQSSVDSLKVDFDRAPIMSISEASFDSFAAAQKTASDQHQEQNMFSLHEESGSKDENEGRSGSSLLVDVEGHGMEDLHSSQDRTDLEPAPMAPLASSNPFAAELTAHMTPEGQGVQGTEEEGYFPVRTQDPMMAQDTTRGARPVKKPTGHATGSAGKKSEPPSFYVDLAYIPHHVNSNHVDVEFFKRVRARYYVVSGNDVSRDEPSGQVLECLLAGKKQWGKPPAGGAPGQDCENVTVLPTHNTPALAEWYQKQHREMEAENIHLVASGSKVMMHNESVEACKIEF